MFDLSQTIEIFGKVLEMLDNVTIFVYTINGGNTTVSLLNLLEVIFGVSVAMTLISLLTGLERGIQ